MYADYTFYTGAYGGFALTEASFTLYANRATAYLSSIIFGTPSEISNELKMAMCAVADEMQKDDTEHGGIQSENVDGYSVSYTGTKLTAKRRYYDIAMMHLSSTDLMGRWL